MAHYWPRSLPYPHSKSLDAFHLLWYSSAFLRAFWLWWEFPISGMPTNNMQTRVRNFRMDNSVSKKELQYGCRMLQQPQTCCFIYQSSKSIYITPFCTVSQKSDSFLMVKWMLSPVELYVQLEHYNGRKFISSNGSCHNELSFHNWYPKQWNKIHLRA